MPAVRGGGPPGGAGAARLPRAPAALPGGVPRVARVRRAEPRVPRLRRAHDAGGRRAAPAGARGLPGGAQGLAGRGTPQLLEHLPDPTSLRSHRPALVSLRSATP